MPSLLVHAAVNPAAAAAAGASERSRVTTLRLDEIGHSRSEGAKHAQRTRRQRPAWVAWCIGRETTVPDEPPANADGSIEVHRPRCQPIGDRPAHRDSRYRCPRASASLANGLLWNDPLSTLMRSSTPVSPGAPGSVGHQPKSGPPKRRTIEGRFDDESRCYSVIITVSRDSARMTVIRRESGPSWSRELGAAAPSGSHCHVARSPDRASDRSPSRRPLLRPLHVSGQFLAGSLLSAI